MNPLTNEEIAEILDNVADLLETQDANPYRVRAYRRAVRTILDTESNLAEVADSPKWKRIDNLLHIGESIAESIKEVVNTGRLRLLERLESQVSPEDLFTNVPGIGDELAKCIHTKRNLDTLEGLELAAHHGIQADRVNTVSSCPKVITPVRLFLQVRKPFEHPDRCPTFQRPQQSRHRYLRWYHRNKIDVISLHIQLDRLAVQMPQKYLEAVVHLLPHRPVQNPVPILRNPYDMVLAVPDRM